MEYYQKVETIEEPIDYSCHSIPVMNGINQCLKTLNESEADVIIVEPASKNHPLIIEAVSKLQRSNGNVLWIGSGPAADKTILCASSTKRRLLNGNNKIYITQQCHIVYKKVKDYWVSVLDGLDKLEVTRNIPTLLILQSRTSPHVEEQYNNTKNSQKGLS